MLPDKITKNKNTLLVNLDIDNQSVKEMIKLE